MVELWHDDGLRSRSFSARAGSLKSRSGSLAGSRTSSIGGYSGLSVDNVGEGALESSITKVTEPTFARALVDVSPQIDGELAFQLGDLIEITEIIDMDWFFGRCHQKEGLVSAVCVELFEELDGKGRETEENVSVCGRSTSSDYRDVNHVTSPPAPHPPQSKDLENIWQEESRLRNSSSASYTSENTRSHDAEIMPYAQVLYPFAAQGKSELSLHEGQIVTLIRHVDSNWTEGEVDGKQGLFPKSFVDIVVDCSSYVDHAQVDAQKQQLERCSDQQDMHSGTAEIQSSAVSNTTLGSADAGITFSERESHGRDQTLESESWDTSSAKSDAMQSGASYGDGKPSNEPGISAGIIEELEVCADSEIGLVLHSFHAQMEGDVSVREGDTVEVVRQIDENWLEVRTEAAVTGMIPRNHVEVIGLWPKEEPNTARTTSNNVTQVQNSSNIQMNISQKTLDTDSGHYNSVSSSQLETTQEIQNLHSEVSMSSKSLSSEDKASDSFKSIGSNKVPNMRSNSLPFVEANQPVKPVIPPKPMLKPKPNLVAKAPMERSQSLNPYKPAKPPLLMTAKPFSSLPRAKPHHVVTPNERRLSLSSLDSIIEGEMEKAKSRSSSQNSDPSSSSEKNGLAVCSTATSVAPSSYVRDSDGSAATVNLGKRTSLPPSFKSSDSLIPAIPSSTLEESMPKSSDGYLSFEDNFNEASISAPSLPRESNTTCSSVSGSKPTLLTSHSVSEDKCRGSSDIDQRRRSASYAERSKGRAGFPTATPQESTNKISFVNKAFQMEVDEGKLVDVGGDHHHLPAMPKRTPPRRPNNHVLPTQPLLNNKVKAPPPRPSGPRIAPAPSKIPLVPARAAPNPPKLVPKRPAPHAPGSAPSANLTANNIKNSRSMEGKSSGQASLISQQLTKTAAAQATRPAPQPPVRQPPRPASLATPPHRAPPPRPSDLIVFSPDDSNTNQDQG